MDTNFKHYRMWLEENSPAGTVITFNGQSETVKGVDIIEYGTWEDGSPKYSIAFYFESGKEIKESDLGDFCSGIRQRYSEYLRDALSFEAFLKSVGNVLPQRHVKSVEYYKACSKAYKERTVDAIKLTFEDGSTYSVYADYPRLALKKQGGFGRGYVDFVGAYFASFLSENPAPDWYDFEDVFLKDNQFLKAVIEHKSKSDGPEVYDLKDPNLYMPLHCWAHPHVTYSYDITLLRRNGVLQIKLHRSQDD